MEKCIFCEIAAKRIPSNIIYEDGSFIAFLDITPLNPGHTLVVPKEHLRWTYDVEKFGDYWEIAKSVALAAIESLGAKNVNFMSLGYGVQHAHIHTIPRFENDGHAEVPSFANAKKISKEEMLQIAEKLKAAIAKRPPKKSVAAQPQAPKVEEPKEEPKEARSKEYIDYIKREMESG